MTEVRHNARTKSFALLTNFVIAFDSEVGTSMVLNSGYHGADWALAIQSLLCSLRFSTAGLE